RDALSVEESLEFRPDVWRELWKRRVLVHASHPAGDRVDPRGQVRRRREVAFGVDNEAVDAAAQLLQLKLFGTHVRSSLPLPVSQETLVRTPGRCPGPASPRARPGRPSAASYRRDTP